LRPPGPIRGGTDLVVVAELLGHARLETVRAYTKPTEEDKAKALNLYQWTADQHLPSATALLVVLPTNR
jgi:hypothetical protein